MEFLDWKEVPAYLAAVAAFFMFIPQVRLAWKGKGHVAWGTACISLFMSSCWIVYGAFHSLAAIMITNGFLVFMMGLIVILQIAHRKNGKRPPTLETSHGDQTSHERPREMDPRNGGPPRKSSTPPPTLILIKPGATPHSEGSCEGRPSSV